MFQQHAQLHQNVLKQCQSSDLVETCLENDVCHLVVTGNLNFSTHLLPLQNYQNDCSNIQKDFDEVFADTFPDVVAGTGYTGKIMA